MLPSKANIKSSLLRFSGATRRRLNALPNGLFGFNYHRIGDRNTTAFDPNVFSCSAEQFDAHLHFLQANFDVIALPELLKLVNTGNAPTSRLALVTFDDGYMDNFELAYPILKRHGVSAIFFASVDFVGNQKLPWWDLAALWIRETQVKQIVLNGQTYRIDTRTADHAAKSIRQVLTAIKNDRRALDIKLASLQDALDISGSDISHPALFMDWQHLKCLADDGMYIGSHTCGHDMLSHLAPDSQWQELNGSKQILEEKLQKPVTALAYPVGNTASFNATTLHHARNAGYEVAFTFTDQWNPLPLTKPLEISRLAIDNDMDVTALKHKIAWSTPV